MKHVDWKRIDQEPWLHLKLASHMLQFNKNQWVYMTEVSGCRILAHLRRRRCSPHAPQDLKQNQILSLQDGNDNEEDGDQQAEEEH